MRRHAKAPTAEPRIGRGSRPGRIRGAFELRGRRRGFGRSGAPFSGRGRLTLFAFSVLVVTVALGAGAALALQTHRQGEDVKTSEVPSGTCCFAGLAVDQSGGDLYAADQYDPSTYANGQVDRFLAGGTYDTALTVEGSLVTPQDVAVDNSGTASDGTIYIADSGNSRVDAIDSSGNLASFGTGGRINGAEDFPGDPDADPAGSFANPCGLAVDPVNGNLFVADQNNGRIWIYDSSGKYLGRVADSALAGPCGIAFDSSGALYVRNSYDGKVLRFNRGSATEFNFAAVFYGAEEGGASDVAVDTADNHVYVDLGNQVKEYESNGSPVSTFGQSSLCCSSAIAVDASSGTVYAAQNGEIRTFGPLVTLPTATTGGVSEVTGTTATLEGTVDAAGGPEAECEFEYGTDESYGQTAPCEPAGPFPGSEAAHANITGLSPATGYHYRLHATSGNGATNGEDRFFVTDGPPQIESLSVSDVETESAKLHATITPSGSATTYHFEYVTEEQFEATRFAGASSVPVPDGAIGSSNEPQVVTQSLSGLAPGVRYRFKVVAHNEVGSAESGPKAFTTFAVSERPERGQFPGQGFLPDNRAWELVSPPNKNGGDVIPTSLHTRAAADGSAIAFASLTAFGDAVGTGNGTEYLAERSFNPSPGTNGWATHAITPPGDPVSVLKKVAGGDTYYQRDFSPDLSKGVLSSVTPLTDDPNVANGLTNLYLRTNLRSSGPGSYSLISACPLCSETSEPIPPLGPTASPAGASLGRPFYAGASADFRTILFQSRRNLTADAPPQPAGQVPECNLDGSSLEPVACEPRVYDWSSGSLVLAGRVPPSGSTTCDDTGSAPCIPADASMAGVGNESAPSVHVISDGSDGHSRIFFTQPTNAQGKTVSELSGFSRLLNPLPKSGRIYMRIDNAQTVELNAPEQPGPEEYAPATYLDATPDGQRVFLLTNQKLTPAEPGVTNLYMYDASKPASDPENLTLISKGVSEAFGVVGVSPSGDYVYFIGSGGPEHLESHGELLVWHNGTVRYIAPMSTVKGDINTKENLTDGYTWKLDPRQARLSPDGRHLLFVTHNGAGVLSTRGGEDEDQSACQGVQSGCRELYLYSAETDSLQCVSCSPTGTPAADLPEVDQATTTLAHNNTGAIPVTWHENQAISANGHWVFFSTAEPLVSRDINGVDDAYEYDSVTGKVRLLSSGEDASPSYFLDASVGGTDAFLATREQLTGWDKDESYDIYDARVGGGFPETPPTTASCQGDACQPPPTEPNDPTPASSVMVGPGNVRHVRRHHHHKKHDRKGHHRRRRRNHRTNGASQNRRTIR